jgi:hypothetical protein
MKLLLTLLLVPFLAFSQSTEVTLKDFKIRGYLGGTRLDSIEATYGQASLPNGKTPSNMDVIREYNFDIGKMYRSDKDIRITNDKGQALNFSSSAGW